MFEKLLLLYLLNVALVATVEGQRQIRHLQLDDAHLIDTSSSNYALYDPKLAAKNNWETVSVNGDRITIWSSDCSMNEKQGFSGQIRRLLESSKSKFNNIDSSQSYSSSEFSFGGSASSHNNYNGGNQISSYSSNNVYVAANGNDNFSITTPSLPDGLARVFYTQKLTTFVYRNGKVQMKPTTCLSASERKLIRQLKSEMEKIKGKMQNFQSSFNKGMYNMEKDMQKLQQSLSNLEDNFPFGSKNNPFGPGFPF